MRYDQYLRDLKELKSVLGQKPGKLGERKALRERFQWFSIWEAMHPEEIELIENMGKSEKKEFIPSRWARSLVCSIERLTSLSPRSVINYRKALTKARAARYLHPLSPSP